ncbi:hypothetical protein HDU67_007747 [Dinochytrium kinnereticum]|nr:hypothetical protein HDU67_007747 [Dinochytrium kinnereticum]
MKATLQKKTPLSLVSRETQPFLIYLHWLNIPLRVGHDSAARFGFRAGTLRNVRIPSSDGIELGRQDLSWFLVFIWRTNETKGAWHILPHDKAQNILSPFHAHEDEYFDQSLKEADRVFLYFHGNAGNRATFVRPAFYKTLTAFGTGDSHVITVDYRGFGDSTAEGGTYIVPSESGMKDDAYSSVNWVIGKGVDPSKIILVGHSLGSGVATFLARNMTIDGRPAGGLVLVAGYATIPDTALSYPNVPLLRPFTFHPVAKEIAKSVVVERWESVKYIKDVTKSPILLVHGRADHEIEIWQAKSNFFSAVEGRVGGNKKVTPPNAADLMKADDDEKSPTVFSDGLFSVRPIGGKGAKEGRLWLSNIRDAVGSPQTASLGEIWLLEITHASHNDVGKFQLFSDAVEEWLLHHGK